MHLQTDFEVSKELLRLHFSCGYLERESNDQFLLLEVSLSIRGSMLPGETTLFLAAACGKWKIFFKIPNNNKEGCMTQRKDGCTVLHAARHLLFLYRVRGFSSIGVKGRRRC